MDSQNTSTQHTDPARSSSVLGGPEMGPAVEELPELVSVTPSENESALYSWTESYSCQTPRTRRARWLRQETFGPVLQSECGASSTVASTPQKEAHTHRWEADVWAQRPAVFQHMATAGATAAAHRRVTRRDRFIDMSSVAVINNRNTEAKRAASTVTSTKSVKGHGRVLIPIVEEEGCF